VALLAVAMAATGCTTNPYCLNCVNGVSIDDGGIKPDLAQPLDMTAPPDQTAPPDLTPGPDLTPPCDTTKLNVDPNNCGSCGNRCDSTSLPRVGVCDNGTCKAGDCVPGFVAVPSTNASCNYQCTVTNNGVEICDGKDNDCNGSIDEPFT